MKGSFAAEGDLHAIPRPGSISLLVDSTYYHLDFDKVWG